ncbi:Myb/SANT-like DNA-binding domain [Popillia japonica]|uniref:Regulatory protein zeste n=1 Tax=Popillia japonica TaxID=7064 RepID=A0AAW1LVZ0_POPJA
MSAQKRAANFNTKEETLLVNLAKKYKTILECQQTDMKSHQAMSVTWEKIESEFNGLSGEMYRPREVLKKKYENIKKRVKKQYAEEKCYARRTGGGPPKQSIFNEVDTAVKEILGTRIEGRLSEFDGDAEIQYEGNKTQGDIASISPGPYMEEDEHEEDCEPKPYMEEDEHEEDCEPNEVIRLDEHEEDCEPNEVIRLVMVNDDPSTQLDSDENHENYGSIINVNIPSTNQGRMVNNIG